MKQRLGIWLIFALLLSGAVVLVYTNVKPAAGPGLPEVTQVMTAGITVEDEAGRKVIFPRSPERIVVLNGYPAEVLCALNAGNRIVGICNPLAEDFTELRGKQSVGNSSVTPDLEKILELRPDLVIAYQWTKKEVIDELERCQIPVLCFRAWTFEELQFFAGQMGKLLDQQSKSQELCRFIQTKMAVIEERTKKLPQDKLPKVFYESFIPYQTTSIGKMPLETPWGTFLMGNSEEAKFALSGGINCVGQQSVRAPIVSVEWVMEKNPDVIIKVFRNADRAAIPTKESLQQVRTEIMQREGLKNLAAVKAGRVYIIHSKMCAGPRQIIGLYYYARWLHPELFADLDPQALHQEMLERFWRLKLQGTWGYPEEHNT
ncbi:hypothetical protein SRRS_10030 [Sporomusa rhizae]|uniref:ABC transporter substrate-binding protein n=1 Tax=Sporomusa rhizae TaxID=357999 RepID=UPI00352B36CD